VSNQRAALPLQNYSDGMSRLEDYVMMMLSRRPGLLDDCQRAGSLGPAVAEAMEEMLDDLHPEERRRVHGIIPELDQNEARKLIQLHGSLRAAAAQTGIAKSAIHRAATQTYRRRAA